MIIVNSIFLQTFFMPIIGGADFVEEFDEFSVYDVNNKGNVKELIFKTLKPSFESQGELRKIISKNTLAYYLIYPKIDFCRFLDSMLLTIETPKDCNLFFQWIWEFFFEFESPNYIKTSKY
jgi:hypothetical protein